MNGLYRRFRPVKDAIDEPNGFISHPFGYHPNMGCYPDLYNHLLADSVKPSNNKQRPERRWPDLLNSLLVHGASALSATVIVILLGEHAKVGWLWILLLTAAFFIGYIVMLFSLTFVHAYISHRFGSRKEQNATRTNS